MSSPPTPTNNEPTHLCPTFHSPRSTQQQEQTSSHPSHSTKMQKHHSTSRHANTPSTKKTTHSTQSKSAHTSKASPNTHQASKTKYAQKEDLLGVSAWIPPEQMSHPHQQAVHAGLFYDDTEQTTTNAEQTTTNNEQDPHHYHDTSHPDFAYNSSQQSACPCHQSPTGGGYDTTNSGYGSGYGSGHGYGMAPRERWHNETAKEAGVLVPRLD